MPSTPATQAAACTFPGYRVKWETVSGIGADLHLRSLLDRDQYHEPSGEAERAGVPESAWPLFGLLWPSSQVLAGMMATYELAGRRVLEMGCGLGLASLVVHRLGGDVTASDCHPLAAGFLRENLRLNDLSAMKYMAANWSRPNPGLGRFDVLIGSDLLYDRGQPEALSQFIAQHSEASSDVLIIDPGRGNQASFTRKMGVLGYAHTTGLVHLRPDGVAYKGRFHGYNRVG